MDDVKDNVSFRAYVYPYVYADLSYWKKLIQDMPFFPVNIFLIYHLLFGVC